MEPITFHTDELIAALVFVLGGGGATTLLAKYKGWITFGKPTERRHCPAKIQQICAEHNRFVVDLANMQSKFDGLNSKMQELNGQMAEMFTLLRNLNGQVERLIGFHQGAGGVNLGK